MRSALPARREMEKGTLFVLLSSWSSSPYSPAADCRRLFLFIYLYSYSSPPPIPRTLRYHFFSLLSLALWLWFSCCCCCFLFRCFLLAVVVLGWWRPAQLEARTSPRGVCSRDAIIHCKTVCVSILFVSLSMTSGGFFFFLSREFFSFRFIYLSIYASI